MKTILFGCALLALFSASSGAVTQPKVDCSKPSVSHILSNTIACYRQSQASQPLKYQLLSQGTVPTAPQVRVKRYSMVSQNWSPQNLVTPAAWDHDVNIYIPAQPKKRLALVTIDMDETLLAGVAQSSHTIVINVTHIPSVALTYQGDSAPRSEDDSVARSWALYLQHPEGRSQLPLHVPMAIAISQTLRLAKQELTPWKINQFVVSSASKRGWAAWLTGITDPSVVAIVPFVADVLNSQQIVRHMYRTWGKNWPIAFQPYYDNGIDLHANDANFRKLMQIEDPLQYLHSSWQSRLRIPKYIVNASGDDFFPPDDTNFYYDQLPGAKSLRIAPNSDHNGIFNYEQAALDQFLTRLHSHKSLPVLTETVTHGVSGQVLNITFSEKPVKVFTWRAINPMARDFRYACDIRYSPSMAAVSSANRTAVSLAYTQAGWQALFVEATFSDGYVATSKVYITPDRYPTTAPPAGAGACQTIAGRTPSL